MTTTERSRFPEILISLDLEFNQPSRRIIQIGATAGNLKTGLLESSFVAYVNPSEPVEPRITKLTGIEQHHVDAAMNLEFVFRQLSKWVSQFDGNRHINPLTWGGGDSDSLRQALGESEEWIFGRRWIDAKNIFTAWRHSQSQLAHGGLAKSMTKVGLRFEGRKHNALDDAVNTWRIYWTLLRMFDNREFPVSERISARLIFDDAKAPTPVPDRLTRDTAAYDHALVALIPMRRVKVAWVLSKAADVLDLVPTDSNCDYLLSRLKLLVADGKVESFGNIDRWRFSEVCRK